MARLIIVRKSEYVNKLRNYNVYLNGKKAGTIANGATTSFEIPEGPHVIEAKIDWYGSQPLTINITENGINTVTIKGSMGNTILAGIGGFFLGLYAFTMFKGEPIHLIAIPGVILILVSTILFRKKYLIVKEGVL
jgi:hypothetical protein